MKLIVIGGSSGAQLPLKTILKNLPDDLDAAVLVLRHVRAGGPSLFAKALRSGSVLPVDEITQHVSIRPGQVYTVPPGMNVTFQSEHDGGPVFHLEPCSAEQFGRPNIDIALTSAASMFGSDCIGVILSGYLDDGAEGAIEVGEHDGVIIVQAPSDAKQASMPLNVIRRDSPEYILPDIHIAGVLRDLARGLVPGRDPLPAPS